MTLMAKIEFERLKGARAWSPITTVVGKLVTKSGVRYTFPDQSRLYVYYNGSASCERVTADVQTFKRNWHYCTERGIK